MSKELTIYPHDTDCGIDCIVDDEATLRIPSELDDFARAKHFTDAELAAEYWVTDWAGEYAQASGYYSIFEECSRKAEVLIRFATLPHALEATR